MTRPPHSPNLASIKRAVEAIHHCTVELDGALNTASADVLTLPSTSSACRPALSPMAGGQSAPHQRAAWSRSSTRVGCPGRQCVGLVLHFPRPIRFIVLQGVDKKPSARVVAGFVASKPRLSSSSNSRRSSSSSSPRHGDVEVSLPAVGPPTLDFGEAGGPRSGYTSGTASCSAQAL